MITEPIVTTDQMKKLEEHFNEKGLSYFDMMTNAGVNAAKEIIAICKEKKLKDIRILFLTGIGNNAGDAFVSAKYLADRGYDVSVFLNKKKLKTHLAQKAYFLMTENSDIKVYKEFATDRIFDLMLRSALSDNNVIVDGIIGTGFHGSFNDEDRELFRFINDRKNSEKIYISYDIPSGGNGTNGTIDRDIFCADYTLTFGFAKTGLYQFPLLDCCGDIRVIDIGFKDDISYLNEISKTSVYCMKPEKKLFSKRRSDANKGDFGKLFCITGSETMPGACAMSTKAALRNGIGLISVATAKADVPALAASCNEATYIPLETDEDGFIKFSERNKSKMTDKLKTSDAVLIGCGIGITEDTKALTKWVIENAECPVIVDADGLKCIADCIDIIEKAKHPVILTPHPGEMSYITGKPIAEIQSSRLDTAAEFIQQHKNCILVLKGAGTVTAASFSCALGTFSVSGDEGFALADDDSFSQHGRAEIFVNTSGNPGMSCGGSGDVLAGIIAADTAKIKNSDAFNVAVSVWIHGTAGDFAAEKFSERSMLPTDTIDMLCEVSKKYS